jgi:hypothetical protein
VRSMVEMKIFFEEFQDCRACVVFHCEFSKNRGPTLMRRFRDHDRRQNRGQYPNLYYPTIYLLQGGYNRFYTDCRNLCDGGYVTMNDFQFVQSGELRRSYSQYEAGGLGDVQRGSRLQRTMSACDSLVEFDFSLSTAQVARSPTVEDVRQGKAKVFMGL